MKATAEGQPTVERKPEINTVSLRTETAYQADEPGRCHSTTDPQPVAQSPKGPAVVLEASNEKHGEAQVNPLAQILSRENMQLAGNSIVRRALRKHWLWRQGVPLMRQQWGD
jgi:hypothetical protein